MRCRLQRVMAAARHQTAADKGQIGNAVEQHQLAHRIANHHLGTAGRDLTAAAQGVAETAFLHHFAGIFKTFGMAWNEDQQ